MSTLVTAATVAQPAVTLAVGAGIGWFVKRSPRLAKDVEKDAPMVLDAVKVVDKTPAVREALARLDKATGNIGGIVASEVSKQLPSALRAAVNQAPPLYVPPADPVKAAEPVQAAPVVVVQAPAAVPAPQPTEAAPTIVTPAG